MSVRPALLVTIICAGLIIAGCDGPGSVEEPNEMVLHHVLSAKIKGLDPGNMRDVYSVIVASQMYEPLYQYHFLKRPYQLVPLLAEDMPQISPPRHDGGLTYTIKIKKGVYFQDDPCFGSRLAGSLPNGKGRELKARDFVFSLKRIANIKYLSQNWSIFDNKIVGLDEFREYTKTCKSEADVDYSRQVQGLTTPDDYTLIIKLK